MGQQCAPHYDRRSSAAMLSNAFFWAIDRSADATFFHDLGAGFGGEFRYIAAPTRRARPGRTPQRRRSDSTPDGLPSTTPARPQLRDAGQRVAAPARWAACPREHRLLLRHRHPADVYSNLRRVKKQRVYAGNLAGACNSVSATYNMAESVFGSTDSTVYGSKPRVARHGNRELAVSTATTTAWPASRSRARAD